MSGDVWGDIITAWLADGTLSAVNGPWFGVAKDATAFPYAVAKSVGDSSDEYHFDGTLIETGHLRVTIFHTTLSQLLTYARAMDDLLVKEEFGASDGSGTDRFVSIMKLPGSGVVDALQKPAADNSTVYFATGLYAVKTQRTLS